jgi:hypothetical protein
MNYIAQTTEHIIVKSDPWILLDVEAGQHLATAREIDVYTDRGEAIAAMQAQYPDYEPTEWEPALVPEVVTMRQGRLALLGAGYLDAVDSVIAQIPDEMQRKAAQIEWEYAITIDRNSQLVKALQQALGITDAMADALFIKAATL